MKHGRIVEHGTYQELLARGVDFHAEVEGQALQLSVPATDGPDSVPAASEPVQAHPAAANGTTSNGVHGSAHLLKSQGEMSPQGSNQATVTGKKPLPAKVELAKGDLVKVRCISCCNCRPLWAVRCCAHARVDLEMGRTSGRCLSHW